LLATAAAAYFLIHQITQVKDLRPSSPGWTGAGRSWPLVASALTYVGAGLNLIGGFVQRLSLGLTTAVQLGGSFINRITPVKVGGMAVNVRYLQKQGLDSATAIGGVGIAVLVGGIMQIALTAVFVVWAGSKARVVKLPSSSTILLVLVVVATAIGLGAGGPTGPATHPHRGGPGGRQSRPRTA
jgi:hypothetical protein